MEWVIVQPGDTLWGISAREQVSLSRLAVDNGLTSPDGLTVGQALAVLRPTATRTVQPGESLWSIAAETGVSVRRLWQLNPQLGGLTALQPGDVLTLQVADPTGGQLSVNGYAYTNIDRAVLRQTLPYLTYLSVFSYGLSLAGDLLEPDDEELIALAKAYGVVPLMMLSTLGKDGTFNSNLASLLFRDAALRTRLIDQLVETVQRKGYGGMDVDFEFILPEERAAYVQFITELTARMNAIGYPVIVALAPKTSDTQRGLLYEAHDYAGLGAAANGALMMTYEWGYTYGPPMAVSPVDKVREVVAYGVSRIPPEKLFMGVPNYGYDWPLPFVAGETRAQSIGNLRAVEIAVSHRAEIQYDPVAQAPFFLYTDERGVRHEVWFQDVRSTLAQLALVPEYALRGVAVWNIMRWFPQLWLSLASVFSIRERPAFPPDL